METPAAVMCDTNPVKEEGEMTLTEVCDMAVKSEKLDETFMKTETDITIKEECLYQEEEHERLDPLLTFPCRRCGNVFATKRDLKDHLREDHKERKRQSTRNCDEKEIEQVHRKKSRDQEKSLNDVFPTSMFESKTSRHLWVAPASSADSDMECDDGEDGDDTVLEPDFHLNVDEQEIIPSRTRDHHIVQPQDITDEEEEDEPIQPKTKRIRRSWKKQEDIHSPPLHEYKHIPPEKIHSPFHYFQTFFTTELMDDIVCQTNLYAQQKDANTAFTIDREEFMVYLGVMIYMSVCSLPCIEDYWCAETRVPQVADVMSSKRFRAIRSSLHFNNNELARTSKDRFFKIRPVISSITEQFLCVPETPTQSVGEVMISYKESKAGNLRQYIPAKSGFKLFCRASEDGFIHDILMYQGPEATFPCHVTTLNDKESKKLVCSKIVIALLKTLKNPSNSTIYADSFFTSLDLVDYIRREYGCRYVGTLRNNRVGNIPLMSMSDMEKKCVSRGTSDYCSFDGILALRWKGEKIVTIVSSADGVEPQSTIKRYINSAKAKKEVSCPSVIKSYNGRMGGVDKSDLLTHLYNTPMRSRKWYVKIFGYALDLCICNAWICYKRDCDSLGEKTMTLKKFRLEISNFTRNHKQLANQSELQPLRMPKRGQRAVIPTVEDRLDASKPHLPLFLSKRQTCKNCSKKGDVHRSRWICKQCSVALCLSDARNCFATFHLNSDSM
ncbi:piggyBac transposable element-derived protein 2-like [Penaeus japonicus]|uniref:piggyBac transposable element-derived protein 2-like n=1 Tax=Penaeus japonicus TaxID=27405 RepID=UPI001C715302|nr:piggyBac transposable element-derived protein 2-like [Penaeus japonicus]